ncbi:hypothetical protein K402DRAFT_360242 [Aulographum hederae CBS 113979]|uniref:Xaa-Pro aminopeptidase n=1 Tax=Aulographum hederae CBS 113979 TaxID=1176131 RepID=A0A6G1GTC9_9PEZI|nr:hypothetical protein K402DRAFT_360242 [Aulographum hederae CBS 113979]
MANLDIQQVADRLGGEARDYWIHVQSQSPMEKYPAKQHAQAVAETLGVSEGLIYLPGTRTVFLEDSDMPVPFRQRRYFYYLSGVAEPDCHLTYDIGTDLLILYIPPIDPKRVIWTGHGSTIAEAYERYDIDKVVYNTDVVPHVSKWMKLHHGGPVYILHPTQAASPGDDMLPGVDYTKLQQAIDQCRVIKDPHEIEMIRKANRISGEAHRKVLENIKDFKNEAQVEAIFLDTCIAKNAKHQAYHPIAASGENGSILHYGQNNEPLEDRQLMVLDAGCEWDCYASDVTRSFPLKAAWPSEEARKVYDLVQTMQTACMEAVKPGVRFLDLHYLAHRIAIDGLLELGILQNGTTEEIFEAGTSLAFFPHGLGHHLGLECHDVSGVPINAMLKESSSEHHLVQPDLCKDPVHPAANLLQEGMVITIEPGIYFSRYALSTVYLPNPDHAKYINKEVLHRYLPVGGVRIEDDILITAKGHENLTVAPKGDEMLKIIKGGEPEPEKPKVQQEGRVPSLFEHFEVPSQEQKSDDGKQQSTLFERFQSAPTPVAEQEKEVVQEHRDMPGRDEITNIAQNRSEFVVPAEYLLPKIESRSASQISRQREEMKSRKARRNFRQMEGLRPHEFILSDENRPAPQHFERDSFPSNMENELPSNMSYVSRRAGYRHFEPFPLGSDVGVVPMRADRDELLSDRSTRFPVILDDALSKASRARAPVPERTFSDQPQRQEGLKFAPHSRHIPSVPQKPLAYRASLPSLASLYEMDPPAPRQRRSYLERNYPILPEHGEYNMSQGSAEGRESFADFYQADATTIKERPRRYPTKTDVDESASGFIADLNRLSNDYFASIASPRKERTSSYNTLTRANTVATSAASSAPFRPRPDLDISELKVRLAATIATFIHSVPENRSRDITGDEIYRFLEEDASLNACFGMLRALRLKFDQNELLKVLYEKVPDLLHVVSLRNVEPPRQTVFPPSSPEAERGLDLGDPYANPAARQLLRRRRSELVNRRRPTPARDFAPLHSRVSTSALRDRMDAARAPYDPPAMLPYRTGTFPFSSIRHGMESAPLRRPVPETYSWEDSTWCGQARE